jgi:UDP-N-acetylmuramyl pentapeptide phosphotransferase/UDP-N-acetylglucosamine-1-phosphate transferase
LLQGVLFYLGGQPFFAMLSLILAGSVSGFLRFNRFPARIFMGDTGSMVVGWVLAISSVQLTTLRFTSVTEFPQEASVSLAVCLMVIPVMDALRVVLLRLINGRSPFRPDNQHFHHDMLRLGWTPQRSIIVLCFFQLFILWLTFSLIRLPVFQLLFIQVFTALLLLSLPAFIESYRKLTHQQG